MRSVLLCGCFVVAVCLLSAFPAMLVAGGVDSLLHHSLAGGMVHRAYSLPALSAFPGDRLPFTNISYNRSDGLFLGIGSDKRLALRFLDSSGLAHISLGYSFGSHYWQAAAGLAYRTGERSTAAVIGSEYYHHTDSHDGWKIASWENSLHAFFAREDYMTWFRRTGSRLYVEQFFSRDLSAVAVFATDRYTSIERTVSWSLFGGDKVFPENPVFPMTDLRTLTVAVRYDGLPALPRAGSGVRVSVQAEKGWQDLSYERWLAEVVVHSLVAPDLTLNTRVRCGSVTGDSFAPKMFAIGGAGTLPGHALNEYEGNRMALWNTELLLHGTAFMGGQVGTSVSLILFCDIGYAAYVAESDMLWKGILPDETGQWKSDVGLALGSANGRIRIGAAWRTDRKESPAIVLRFSPSLPAAR